MVLQKTEQENDSNQEGEGGYKSRIRVVCDRIARTDTIESFSDDTLPLTILGEPKPAQGRFYVAKDNRGTPQDDKLNKEEAGYSQDYLVLKIYFGYVNIISL